MKKILSKSKMREVLQLPYKDGKTRTALFENGKITELEPSDLKYLQAQESGPFNFLVGEGTFSILESEEAEDKEPVKSTKLDLEIAKLEKEKAKKESKGKVFHHNSQTRLTKLLAEKEEAKTRQGE